MLKKRRPANRNTNWISQYQSIKDSLKNSPVKYYDRNGKLITPPG